MPTRRHRPGDPQIHGGPRTLPPLAALLVTFTATASLASAPAPPNPGAPTTSSPTSASPTATSPATPDTSQPATSPATPGTSQPATSPPTPDTSQPATSPPTSASSAPPTASATPTSTPATTSPPASAATPANAALGRPASKPPRVDGPYIGGTIAAGGSFARVNNFPTPDPLSGGTASLRFGQAIYPWMTIGLQVTGTWSLRFADPRQRLLQGAALVDFGFLPVPRIPLSLHVGFGAGGGAVRQADRTARSGFGGAVFTGSVRYEIFPLADRKRPRRGGGFSLGPELGWIGFTPAAKGRPMSNTVYIGLFLGFYFGS